MNKPGKQLGQENRAARKAGRHRGWFTKTDATPTQRELEKKLTIRARRRLGVIVAKESREP